MLKFTMRLWLILACLLLAGLASTQGQIPLATNAPSTNAPPATPTPKPFALGDVVAQAQAAGTTLKDIQSGLDPDPALQEVQEALPKLTTKIDQRIAEDTRQSKDSSTLNSLDSSQLEWMSLSDSLDSEQKNLSDRVHTLDQLLWQLSQMDASWKATLDETGAAKAPTEITSRITEVRAEITMTLAAVQSHQTPLYAMQNSVAAQAARAKSGLDSVNKQLDTARQELFIQNSPALWNPAAFAHPASGMVGQEKASLDEQVAETVAYLKTKIGAVLVNLVIFLLLLLGFYWIRNTVKLHVEKEPALENAARIFDAPFVNALFVALLASVFLYPDAPRVLHAALGAATLVPALVLTRRLIDSDTFPILYATMIAFLVDQLRFVVTPAGILLRSLFILELLAVSIFILFAFRFKHLSTSCTVQTRLARLTRLYLHVAFLVFVFAGLANVLGYTKLSISVGNGMLDSSYLAVVLYVVVRILDALAISAMSIRPLSGLGMVRRHKDLLYANTTLTIRWVVFFFWLAGALQFFSQLGLIVGEIKTLFKTDLSWFSLNIPVGAIVAFPTTLWASFLVSRFVRFVLEEEVYPQMTLGRGVPYAASTMVHYIVLVLGFFVAVAATGADLSQFAFLAGAVGVGLGFGLQNILNNFVSGIILLFERPIKVGDTIQIDATTVGTVERIGIRASVILLSNGAELIVPNGNLISNPVTNWTLSNCERLIEIPISVTSAADPQRVLALLIEVARDHRDVIKNPPPEALLITVTGTTLTFRLRAWIDAEDKWMQVTSDLSLAIQAALARENIAIS